jgi:two-component system, chemotaxis family, chemotaxis protein CheY
MTETAGRNRSNFIYRLHVNFIYACCDHLNEICRCPSRLLKVEMAQVASQLQQRIAALKVLVVDDEHTMRKVTRSLLQVIGVKTIYEASDVRSGLEVLCTAAPDVVILDWEMPNVSGLEFIRQVRAPDKFPFPDVPIIMLTAFGERSRVIEAVKLGVNEFLLKPVSSKALLARMVSVLTKPRRMVKKGDRYVPEPRKLSSYKPENDPGLSEVVLVI